MKRKRMIKLLMGMGYSRNWANHFATVFSIWGLPYAGFEDALLDPYEYQFNLVMKQYGHLFKDIPKPLEILNEYQTECTEKEYSHTDKSIKYGFTPYAADFHRIFFPTRKHVSQNNGDKT